MNDGYIHGFSPAEQARLVHQAEVLAPVVLDGLDLPAAGDLLELGCGVGAQLGLIGARRPALGLTGLDLSATHLAAAARLLAGRAGLVRGDAARLPFPAASFDRVLTIWLLEHLACPAQVIREALRVLRPGGELICTEVDNATFAFEPRQPAIATWWERFNRCQQQGGGAPFVGSALARAAAAAGCRDCAARPLLIMDSRRDAARRESLLAYLRDLLLSGAERMRAAGLADQALQGRLLEEMDAARHRPDIRFRYGGVRLVCRAPG